MKTLILFLLIASTLSGQTTAEKIKAKFKQINDAKIERLKECEDNKLKITTDGTFRVPFTKLPEENPTPKELQLREYFDKYDLAGTPITKNATGESKNVYLLTLSSIIKLWDEYAKECASTYTYVVETYWLEQPVLEFPDYESFRKWNATWGDNYKAEVQSKQPDPIEFINVFLRNKLKEN